MDLPPVLSYLTRYFLRDPQAPVWRVFFTEWVAAAAAMWLWECYDTNRMWYLPNAVRNRFGWLDLSTVLGGAANQVELESLLELYKTVDWDDPVVVPPQNAKNKQRKTPNLSPGRKHVACGDWVWVDAWAREVVDFDTRAQRRKIWREPSEAQAYGFVVVDGPTRFDDSAAAREVAPDEMIVEPLQAEEEMADAGERAITGAGLAFCEAAAANDASGADRGVAFNTQVQEFLRHGGVAPAVIEEGRDAVVTEMGIRHDDARVAKLPAVAVMAVRRFLLDAGVLTDDVSPSYENMVGLVRGLKTPAGKKVIIPASSPRRSPIRRRPSASRQGPVSVMGDLGDQAGPSASIPVVATSPVAEAGGGGDSPTSLLEEDTYASGRGEDS